MKKLLLFLITLTIFVSCSTNENEAIRIEYTSSSEEAKALFTEFQRAWEQRNWNPDRQEALMDSILKLDPNFYAAKLRNNFGTGAETRQNLLDAYNNRTKLTDIEKRLIEAEYERRINGNRTKEDKIVDDLIEDYPNYYQLRIYSGGIKNALQNIKGSQKRWQEALEVNPKSFEAHVSLAFLHFPTGNDFNMLAVGERDLDVAKDYLNKGSKIYPESSRWSRFLGNVYRAEGDFEKAEIEYQKSLDIISDFEAGPKSNPYANSLLMMGHVNTFTGKYDKARDYYDQGIAISNNYWKVSMTELKAHTYMYQKNFGEAILTLSELQSMIDDMDDEEEITKNNYKFFAEFNKFLAFGHSQKQTETLESLNRMSEFRSANTKIRLENAFNDEQRDRISTGTEKNKVEMQLWFNILFGNYEDARELLLDLKTISEKQLAYNPNSMNDFHKLSGYLNLMEGDPVESINSYANLSNEVMTNDSYHSYFLALAKRGIGETEESNRILSLLANDNFATWQNAIVKNLAKAQIEVNL
tara:strand:- start:2352 stop:3932 length:1581 start_codon:yes stop_codon:yes gene_type:complete